MRNAWLTIGASVTINCGIKRRRSDRSFVVCRTAAELADKVGMTRSRASAYLSILTRYRVIKQTGIRRLARGRPVNLYAANRAQ